MKDILYYANFSIIESRPICIYRIDANLYLLHWGQSFYWIEANLLIESRQICIYWIKTNLFYLNQSQSVYLIETNMFIELRPICINWISRPICIYWIEANLFYLNHSQSVYLIQANLFLLNRGQSVLNHDQYSIYIFKWHKMLVKVLWKCV